MIERFEVDETFDNYLVFSEKLPFIFLESEQEECSHRGTDLPHDTTIINRDLPNVSVLSAVSNTDVYGPFSFAEAAVTDTAYLDMLEQWLWPQLKEDFPWATPFPTG
jgi:hypothetical protein